MENTEIEWATHSFNPWQGCVKISDGCTICYAETLSKRWGKDIWGPAKTTSRQLTSDSYWNEPIKWNRKAKEMGERHRVFCASMSDVFEDHPQVLDARRRLLDLIVNTPHLDWLLLTKRPENVNWMIEQATGFSESAMWFHTVGDHVWMGTSVEDQANADKRIPELLNVPAKIRFLSCEPLLSEIDLSRWLGVKENEDATAEHGRLDLSFGRERGIADRQRRANLESEITSLESLAKLHDGNSNPAEEGRARHRRIPRDTGDGGRGKTERASSQVGVDALQGANTRRDDDQPQEREEEIQSPGQLGIGNSFGADNTCASRPESGPNRSEWREERNGETDNIGGQRDLRTENYGRDVETDSERLRGNVSDNIQDSKGRSAISWIIVGGESGHGARLMDPSWADSLIAQCQAAGVAIHVKQLGSVLAKKMQLNSAKGGDWNEWPERLRIREYPLLAQPVAA